MRDVFIIGVGQTPVGELWARSAIRYPVTPNAAMLMIVPLMI